MSIIGIEVVVNTTVRVNDPDLSRTMVSNLAERSRKGKSCN